MVDNRRAGLYSGQMTKVDYKEAGVWVRSIPIALWGILGTSSTIHEMIEQAYLDRSPGNMVSST